MKDFGRANSHAMQAFQGSYVDLKKYTTCAEGPASRFLMGVFLPEYWELPDEWVFGYCDRLRFGHRWILLDTAVQTSLIT